MPRIRSIKPEYWADEKMAPLPPITRLVFLGLVSMADDAGRLVDNIKQIDAFIFPETEDSAREPVAHLEALGRIRRGVTGSGQKVIQIVNWHHQKIDRPNRAGSLPPILGDEDPTDQDNETPTIDEAASTTSGPDRRTESGASDTHRVVVVEDSPKSRRKVAASSSKPRRASDDGSVSGSGSGSTIKDPSLRGERSTTSEHDPPTAASWPARLTEAWANAVGVLSVGRIGKALKPLVDKHGEDLVARAIRHYGREKLDAGELKFASPEDFARTAVQWIDYARPVGTGTLGVVR